MHELFDCFVQASQHGGKINTGETLTGAKLPANAACFLTPGTKWTHRGACPDLTGLPVFLSIATC